MAYGEWGGLTKHSPEFRAMFTREAVISSDWYQQRLEAKQQQDIRRAKGILGHIASVRANDPGEAISTRLGLASRRDQAQAELARVSDPAYVDFVKGSIGAQPFD